MGGHSQKKRRMARKASYEKEAKRIAQRIAREAAAKKANEFFSITEMLRDELLKHCDWDVIVAIGGTCTYARDIVKGFTDTNLAHLVEDFVGANQRDNLFGLLETSHSALAGSLVTAVLTAPYRHNEPDFVLDDPRTGVLMPPRWTVTNLDLVLPQGIMSQWREFLDNINLAPAAGYTISLTESRDDSILTPIIGSTSTFNTNFATSSKIYSLYAGLLTQRRAIESWFPTPVLKSCNITARRYRSSFSTGTWEGPCGWACPVLWRQVRGLAGVGIFHWGGRDNVYPDTSTAGIPYTNNNMKWRLGDTCTNKHCPWYGGNYFTSVTSAPQRSSLPTIYSYTLVVRF
ncbi:hypothetical protein DFH06DRAFT_1131886 [Mycena polygramma]|nr:hypothetical protein DFH06DRAFT_1131886 [Mycena polygramma]